MNRRVKFRIGDTVYHRTLDLGRGKIRYIYHAKLRVAFEKLPAGRYSKEELCKSEPHPASQPDSGELRGAKALAHCKDFLTLWKDADPDIPILKEAKAEYAKLQ